MACSGENAIRLSRDFNGVSSAPGYQHWYQIVLVFFSYTSLLFLYLPTDGVAGIFHNKFSYHLMLRREVEESDELSLEEKDEKCRCLSRDSNPQ